MIDVDTLGAVLWGLFGGMFLGLVVGFNIRYFVLNNEDACDFSGGGRLDESASQLAESPTGSGESVELDDSASRLAESGSGESVELTDDEATYAQNAGKQSIQLETQAPPSTFIPSTRH